MVTDFTVVIVGGGFSGTLVASHLLRQREVPLRVAMIERRLPPTHGVAYSTHRPGHLLNVRAKNMSAFPDDPDHFVRWARDLVPALTGDEFLPRAVYGEYLYTILTDASRDATPNRFEIIPGAAVGVAFEPSDRRPGVVLDTGVWIRASSVVLALGNYPPPAPDVFDVATRESTRYVGTPWDYDRLAGLGKDDTVLLIGTGLTMVDCLIALRELGHRGPIHAVSRRGLLPFAHDDTRPLARSDVDGIESERVRELVQGVRALVARAERDGRGWRSAVDALRQVTQDLWRGLPERERARFLRHAVRFWEVCRHRIAPEVGRYVSELVGAGRLTVHQGRIESAKLHQAYVEVGIRERRTGREKTVCAQRVVNCAGPACDFRTIDDPFVADLRDRGIIVPDALGLGIHVDEEGAVLTRHGRPSEVFHAIGPLRKGLLWESTAVPELRCQADNLAGKLVRSLVRGEAATTST
jgi:uncharacterized NAD(P)/FAD-binding protein YdhS